MNYLEFKKYFAKQAFFSLDMLRLLEPNFSRIQLTRWQQKGYIQPIIRGWYRLADISVNEELLMLIANKIVDPSYISLEFALSFYHLIPEGVFQITSITSKKTRQFDTALATFNYRHVKPMLMFGYVLRDTPFGQIRIASLEKALLDFLYLTPQADSIEFFDEMRFSKEVLEQINQNTLKQYLAVFNQQTLNQRTQRLLDYVTN